MIKLNDFNEQRKYRHEAWIKECVEEKQELLKRVNELDETILDYRMRRRSDLNRKVTELITFDYFVTIMNSENLRNYEHNKGLYWFKNKDNYLGLDNSEGQADVKKFSRLEDCINWLIGEEL